MLEKTQSIVRPWSGITSEDVIATARSFNRNGITDPEDIRGRLSQWDAASVWGVLREIERATGKAPTAR
jgi:hypothetical protein